MEIIHPQTKPEFYLTHTETTVVKDVWKKFVNQYPLQDINYLLRQYYDISEFEINEANETMHAFIDHLPRADYERLIRLSKISSRIYEIDLQQYGESLMLVLVDCIKITSKEQLIFIGFLNKVLNLMTSYFQDSLIQYDENRLSFSESNYSSNLSLNIDDNSIKSLDNSTETIIPAVKPFLQSPTSIKSMVQSVELDDIEDFDHSNESNSINDNASHITQEESKTTDSPNSSNESLSSDDALDYLNAFNVQKRPQASKSQSNKKFQRRLSTNFSHLSRNSSKSSSTTLHKKQDCVIV